MHNGGKAKTQKRAEQSSLTAVHSFCSAPAACRQPQSETMVAEFSVNDLAKKSFFRLVVVT